MMKPTLPENEKSRLLALESYCILDTLPEQVYDDITFLAAKICNTPVALVTLVDAERQWFKSKYGLNVSETNRDYAFCAHALNYPNEQFIIPDMLEDERFVDHPFVTESPFIRFYAGTPLVTDSGEVLGTLCVIDNKPRILSSDQKDALNVLARMVMSQFEVRYSLIDAEKNIEIQEQMEAIMLESEERFQGFMAHAPVIAFVKNAEGRYNFVNLKFFEVFNKKPDDVLGKLDSDIWPPEISDVLMANDRMILSGNAPINVEESTSNPDGSLTYWHSCKFPLRDAAGNKLLAGLSIDITDRKNYEVQLEDYQRRLEAAISELERLSATDSLTGLKNKGAFSQRLDDEIARAKRYNLPLSLLYIDIDKFKEFNDTFGHVAGDDTLQQVARILESYVRPSDFLARIGGEEFAVILPCTSGQGGFILAERLRRSIESAVWPKRNITISIGIAETSDALASSLDLMKSADLALYKSKHNGRNRVSIATV